MEIRAGYKPKEDERIVKAHQLEAMLCQHELRLRISGGWWCISSAAPVEYKDRPATIRVGVYLLSSLRKRRLKAYTMSMPNERELLVKINTRR